MRVVFLGTPAFAVPALDALGRAGHEIRAVVAQPDRPAGRGRALREPETKVWGRGRGLEVLQPEKVRDGRLAAALGPMRPDVLVVAAYGRILGADLLRLAPFGAVNVHASLLPRYRGAAPIQWAIARGETETGVSIMAMDEGLDTGDVLLQRTEAIRPDDTAETLSERLAALGGQALVKALAMLERGEIVPVGQDAAKATLAPILRREDGRIDWARPSPEVHCLMRGFAPWPGAWTTLDGKVVKVLEATVQEAHPDPASGAPGSASVVAGQGIAVRCGPPTGLLVRRIQLEGRAAQAAVDFARGLRRERIAFGT
ncbi:MAG TPA: methionyl-tRNA formyltransferase [Anaeromyxobacteraceae bacterium]|nr:methionyl-tRNA formyltransferase [Anaeromyxobacteraceae bacterium]